MRERGETSTLCAARSCYVPSVLIPVVVARVVVHRGLRLKRGSARVLNRLRAWGVHSTGSIVNIEDLERLKTAAAAADA